MYAIRSYYGVDVPSSFGAEGHSDADVLTHAICDALLGAAGLRDIGFHFPDTEPGYKGVSSLVITSYSIHYTKLYEDYLHLPCCQHYLAMGITRTPEPVLSFL